MGAAVIDYLSIAKTRQNIRIHHHHQGQIQQALPHNTPKTPCGGFGGPVIEHIAISLRKYQPWSPPANIWSSSRESAINQTQYTQAVSFKYKELLCRSYALRGVTNCATQPASLEDFRTVYVHMSTRASAGINFALQKITPC